MSVRPLDIMMAITQSQNLKSPDSDAPLKYAQQAQHLVDQNIKSKEAVLRIPDNENHTEVMDTIKQGMTDNSQGFFSDSEYHENPPEEFPEKAILDDDNGNSIDIIG